MAARPKKKRATANQPSRGSAKKVKSLSLSDECLAIMEELSEQYQVSESMLVEIAMRNIANEGELRMTFQRRPE